MTPKHLQHPELWTLTPAERRIAEIAFAQMPQYGSRHYRGHQAARAVLELRGEHDPCPSSWEDEAMTITLRGGE